MRARTRATRRVAASVLALLLACVLAGCSFRAQQLPLPGGPDLGDNPYRITAEFSNVLDLVPNSTVKVSDVTVGEVEKVELDDYTARVTMRLRGSVQLPDNATARIRQTSLLGEKFVSLAKPEAQQSRGSLGDGDLIRLDRTGRNIEVEEVLTAMSALLNGGGIAQLETIQEELNKALDGRESEVRDLLRRLERVMGDLDERKRDITRAIDRMDRLAAKLSKQRDTIARTVDELPRAVEILADQRKELTTLLEELSELGKVGTRVINSTQEDLTANLRALDPVLTELANAGDSLPKSLELLFTYPFPDSAARAVRGDYTNMQLTIDANLQSLLKGEGPVSLPLPDGGDTGDGGDGDRDQGDGGQEDGEKGDGDQGNGDQGDGDDRDQPSPDPGDGDESSPPPDDEDDGILPCLPLLCPDDGSGAAGAKDTGGSAGGDGSASYDPELAGLLVPGASAGREVAR